jgi:glycosyltransferase involved in cell wall biosynthesis
MSEVKRAKRVLIISHDTIGGNMAGPGIRYHYMAETLSEDFDVTVGFFDPSYVPEESFRTSYKPLKIDAYYFEKSFKGFDVVIAHWLSDAMIHYCNKNNIFIVFDLYVPGPVENLASFIFSDNAATAEKDFEYRRSARMYRLFFENGDLFLVSNQRQLDYWTGYFFGANQVAPSTYPKRPLYNRFIFAPMGIDTKHKITHKKQVIKGVIPGIKKTDKVLLWTGGIWNHFDGQILIRAMEKLKHTRPDIKLLFLGIHHPNPSIPEMKESVDTRRLAEQLDLTNKTVFFNEGWVDYPDRINYLLEADAAVNTHKSSIESEFSHRTRVLDHIWSGLPTISTVGDYLSDQVIKPKKLGIVVPPNDVDALFRAITTLLEPKINADVRRRIDSIQAAFSWSATLRLLHQILLEGPEKLPRLEGAHRLRKSAGPILLLKRLIPVPVKKLIVRILRLK